MNLTWASHSRRALRSESSVPHEIASLEEKNRSVTSVKKSTSWLSSKQKSRQRPRNKKRFLIPVSKSRRKTEPEAATEVEKEDPKEHSTPEGGNDAFKARQVDELHPDICEKGEIAWSLPQEKIGKPRKETASGLQKRPMGEIYQRMEASTAPTNRSFQVKKRRPRLSNKMGQVRRLRRG